MLSYCLGQTPYEKRINEYRKEIYRINNVKSQTVWSFCIDVEQNQINCSRTRITTRFDRMGNVIMRTWFDSDSTISYHNRFQYDQNGNMLMQFTASSDTSSGKLLLNTYNQNGKLECTTQYRIEKTDTILEVQTNYYFDKYGKLDRAVIKNVNDKYYVIRDKEYEREYFYNQSEQLIKVVNCFEKKKETLYIYKYDQSGRRYLTETYSNGLYSETDSIIYNEDGNVLFDYRRTTHDLNMYANLSEHVYDDSGRIVLTNIYMSGSLYTTYKHSYSIGLQEFSMTKDYELHKYTYSEAGLRLQDFQSNTYDHRYPEGRPTRLNLYIYEYYKQ